MRSFTKTILAAALFAVSLGMASAVAPNLTVHLKNQLGNPVPGTQVAAIEFGMNGPSTYTVIGIADSFGNANLTVAIGHSYNLYYSSHGFSPAIADQFNNPEYDPNRYVYAMPGGVYFSTFTLTSGLTNVGRLVQPFTGSTTTTNMVLFGGVYNMISQMQAGSGIVQTNGSGNGTLVVDNVPFADANTYNIGLYDPALNRGIGRNVMSALNDTEAPLVGGVRTLSYAALSFTQAVPPTRVENTAQQGGGSSNAGASVEGVLMSTNSTPVGRMGVSVKACFNGYQWNNWANSDENGRFQLYGLTPGVTYYFNVMGGCTWSQNGPGSCYEPYSSAQYNASDVCGSVQGTMVGDMAVASNDILYVSSDVAYHNITLNEMPKSIGQISVYVKSNSGIAIPNSNVNLNPDGMPWPKTPFSCSNSNNYNQFFSTNFVNSPGFSNANVNATTGYALLDGLPSGNYMLNVWTPFSSGGNGPSSFNGGSDGQFGFGNNNMGGGQWAASHCSGYGVDDYRITIDTMAAQTMHVYDSSGTDLNLSSITYIVSAGGSNSGEIKGVLRFPSIVDLSANPITITLYGQCSMSMSTTGPSACPAGNFTAVSGSGLSQYPYTINVSSGFSYYMNVTAMNWGRVNRGGGDNTISLVSTGTAVIDMDFAAAGSITGTVYKPDGTILTPSNNQYISVNASGNNSWTQAQLQKDGTFAMNDVLPGVTRIYLYAGGSAINYTLPVPAPTVTVVANTATTFNLNLVKSNYVGMRVFMSSLPVNSIMMDGEDTVLGYKIIPLPAGTVLKGETISKMLTGGDEEGMRVNYSEATGADGRGRCGSFWPGGFCATAFPSPAVYDFYLMRSGDFAKSTATAANAPYPHFTLISSSKNVVIDDSRLVVLPPNMRPAMSTGPVSGIRVNLTPAVNMSARGNAALKGSVTADNFFRNSDYEATGGDFESFVKYLPVVSLYDASGGFAAAGVVLPPPSYLASEGENFDIAFAQGYTQFKALLDGSPTGYGYEIRGLAPSTCYTAVLTTPNYPPYQSKVCMGVNGSTTTVSIDMDTAVGAGATLQGVVKTTANVVLANVEVKISGEGVDTKSVVTSSVGFYRFEGLPAGTVRINASLSGYAAGEAEEDLTGSNVYAKNFQLTAAAGSITGTVYSQKIPYSKVQPGAIIVAYDDTYNGTLTPGDPLPLIKTKTGADGLYKLEGLIPLHYYKVFLKVPGKYTLTQTTQAAAGIVSGVDFTMLAKPLDLEIFAKKTGDNATGSYEFTVLNPQDFKTGEARWAAQTSFSFAAATVLNLEKLSSGELRGTIPMASLTPGITYILQGNATSYSNKTVSRQIRFGTDYKGNAEQHIDDAILGDDSDDGFGRKSNEVSMDRSGDDASALMFPAGAMQFVSTGSIPTCSFKGEDKDADSVKSKVDALGADAFAGDVYTVTLTSVALNDGKAYELTLAYDKSTADLNDLSVAQYNNATSKWEEVPGVATINPVKGTVKVKLKTLASVLATKSGGYAPMGVFNGREYVVRPLSGGSSSSGGTFAVIRPSVAGTDSFTGAKVKVFNYPNPFNLKDKAISNSHGAAIGSTVNGTVIHVEVPAGNGGPGHVRIYTLAGELVKDISVTFEAGKYNYVGWDGHNKGGQEVANGVYYGVVEMTGKSPDSKDATFKMAVIK